MKKKPDLAAFQPAAKDPNEFLDGAAADLAERQANVTDKPTTAARRVTVEGEKREATVQKIFRLRSDVAQTLKLYAAQQGIATGKRVTETEIVEELLCERLNLKR